MNQANIVKLDRIVKSRKAIVINNKFIKRILGLDDMRDFYRAVSEWGDSTDFTYQTEPEDNQSFLRRFIKENYLS